MCQLALDFLCCPKDIKWLNTKRLVRRNRKKRRKNACPLRCWRKYRFSVVFVASCSDATWSSSRELCCTTGLPFASFRKLLIVLYIKCGKVCWWHNLTSLTDVRLPTWQCGERNLNTRAEGSLLSSFLVNVVDSFPLLCHGMMPSHFQQSVASPPLRASLLCTASVSHDLHLHQGQTTACTAVHKAKRLNGHQSARGQSQEISKKVLRWPLPPRIPSVLKPPSGKWYCSISASNIYHINSSLSNAVS